MNTLNTNISVNVSSNLNSNSQKENQREPIFSLKGHSSQIFTLESDSKNDFFSSGKDGVIKHWALKPDLNLNGGFHHHDELTKLEVCTWQASNEIIWSLKYFNNKLASASCDGAINIWEVENKTFNSSKCRLANIALKNFKLNKMEIPTCLAWYDDNSIFSSFVSPFIRLYDIETRKSKLDIDLKIEQNIPEDYQQANKLIYDSNKSLLVSGHENHLIKFHDPRIQGIFII